MERSVDQLVAGKYRLLRRLARGGMGSVWQATHVDLQVDVALKFIRSDAGDPARSRERFRQEARLLAQLRSPHIVQILDFGIDDDEPYIAMEFLRGQDLGMLLERRATLNPDQAFSMILEAARGLAVAHRAGVIHRDVKPSNLFVVEHQGRSTIKLIDFGIAKQHRVDSHETADGLVVGSPAFMSPEQARGARVDASSDVWSLAAVAYRMLTGHAPIEGDNPSDTVVRLCTERPRLVSTFRPDLGTAFDELFQHAFAPAASERLAELGSFTEGWARAVRQHDPSLRRAADDGLVLGPSPDATTPRPDHAAMPSAQLRQLGRDTETASLSLTSQKGAGEQRRQPSERAGGSWAVAVITVALVCVGWIAFFSMERRSRSASVAAPPAAAEASATPFAHLAQPVPLVLEQSPAPQGTAWAVPEPARQKTAPVPAVPRAHRPFSRGGAGSHPPIMKPATAAAAPLGSAQATDPVFGLPVNER